jgi:hypothetical protein
VEEGGMALAASMLADVQVLLYSNKNPTAALMVRSTANNL